MRCLESLSQDSFSGKRTVFLIDNAQSLDRSLAARLPSLDIEIDRPARNLGFAEGAPAVFPWPWPAAQISSCF